MKISKKIIPDRLVVKLAISLIFLLTAIWLVGPGNLLNAIGEFPAHAILLMVLFFLANLAIVTIRLHRLLFIFGFPLPFRYSLQASVSGYLGSLFMISLVGQVTGRFSILRSHHVSAVVIATLTAYEKAFLLFISGGLGLLGFFILFSSEELGNIFESFSIFQYITIFSSALTLTLLIGKTNFERNIFQSFGSLRGITGFFETGALSLAATLLVLLAFAVGVKFVAPNIDATTIFAACAVISFASTLPITVNGWGIREMASVYILGKIGVPAAEALSISIVVGICATFAVILSSSVLVLNYKKNNSNSKENNLPAPSKGIETTRRAIWVISTACAILVFIQLHVQLPSGTINLNLADPFAILAGTALILQSFVNKTTPNWSVRKFNLFLVTITILFAAAFVNGISVIGVTQWALAGKLFGWLVLMCYLSTGYLVASYLGRLGVRRFMDAMICTASVIVIIQISLRWLNNNGFIENIILTSNFEGYTGNRNAFALQLIFCLAISLVYSNSTKFLFESGKRLIAAIPSSILISGIFFTNSRAGLFTTIIMLIAIVILRWSNWRLVLTSIIGASLIVLIFSQTLATITLNILPSVVNDLTTQNKQPSFDFFDKSNDILAGQTKTIPGYSTSSSDTERWATLLEGFKMWLQQPIFGSGLGVFIETSKSWSSQPVVIHNTGVWILAEMGIIGFSIIAFILFAITRTGINAHKSALGKLLLLNIGVILIFSLVHEVFYQRIFWLILGCLLASRLMQKKYFQKNYKYHISKNILDI